MSTLCFLLSAAVLISCSQLVLGPVLVYLRLRPRADPRIFVFDPEQPPWTLPYDYVIKIVEMEELGFTLTAHLYQDEQTPGVRSLIPLFTHRQDLTAAMVVHMEVENQGLSNHYVEFTTDFEDGSELCCNNTHQVGVFGPNAKKLVFSLPHLRSTADLYGIHQRLLETKRKSATRKLPAPGQEVDELRASIARDFDRQVDCGYFRYDPSTEQYRPTVKGAVLMTSKLAWPVGSILRRLQYLKGQRIARRLGKGTGIPWTRDLR